ncbi:hypothetical protein PCANC_25103 [Puccinia coronata f. sp. avenae]|uniref:Uncharacterized protein n=1 Tax=Puccinia coronata f. sp. avenae TaxID=200324 RepID=A0A2N5UDG7_9BASI|nr:hypothetical protein PCANC_25103 [Puccinia coronata f. sp. avenae]
MLSYRGPIGPPPLQPAILALLSHSKSTLPTYPHSTFPSNRALIAVFRLQSMRQALFVMFLHLIHKIPLILCLLLLQTVRQTPPPPARITIFSTCYHSHRCPCNHTNFTSTTPLPSQKVQPRAFSSKPSWKLVQGRYNRCSSRYTKDVEPTTQVAQQVTVAQSG